MEEEKNNVENSCRTHRRSGGLICSRQAIRAADAQPSAAVPLASPDKTAFWQRTAGVRKRSRCSAKAEAAAHSTGKSRGRSGRRHARVE